MALKINKYSDTIVLFTILGLLLIIFLFILLKNKKEGFLITVSKNPTPPEKIDTTKLDKTTTKLYYINQKENEKCGKNFICGNDLVCSEGLCKKKK
jgi:hypothetical protein